MQNSEVINTNKKAKTFQDLVVWEKSHNHTYIKAVLISKFFIKGDLI